MKRACAYCGKEFETTSSRAKFCNDMHYGVCKVCGKQFSIPRSSLSNPPKCCSKECANVAKRNDVVSRVYTSTCILCGEQFESRSVNAKICNKHTTAICQCCGKEFNVTHTEILADKKTCSDECRYKLSVQSYKSRDQSKAHAQQIQTMLDRYGVASTRQIPGVNERIADTKRKLYGEHFEKITEKIQATTQARYGSPFLMQIQQFKEKSKQTCVQKYGVDNYAKSTKFLQQAIIDASKAEVYAEFKSDPKLFISSHFDAPPTLAALAAYCGVRDSSMGWLIVQLHLEDMIAYTFSKMEDEVYTYLQEISPELEIQRNTFKIITPYELDLYIPELKLGIECNPTITHNSTVPGFSNEDIPKSKDYHKMKNDLCDEKGIQLFHIFGYEWTHRKAVIKSMLASLLHVSAVKVHARRTKIVMLTDSECMQFLDENHRQGGAHSKIRLGLEYNNAIVAVMTFSNMRNTIGATSQTNDCWELVRFCNKLNTNVVGGASKLFQHFVREYDPVEIRSFSDRAHTKGTLYQLLGFQYDHTSDAGYVWVNLKTDQAFSRNNAQKHNIRQFLKDDTIDLSQTETQIMADHGYVQVFDAGVKLWIWRKEMV